MPWGDRVPRKAFRASIEAASILCENILPEGIEEGILVCVGSVSNLEHLAGRGEKAEPCGPVPEHVTVGVVVKLSPELDTGLCWRGWNAEGEKGKRGSNP